MIAGKLLIGVRMVAPLLFIVAAVAHPPVAKAQAKPASGTIDNQRSRVYVKVGKTGLGHEHGVVGILSEGTVLLGQAQQAGVMKFDLTKFAIDTAEARKFVALEKPVDDAEREKVSTTMHGEKVLDVKQFPEAVFEIKSAKKLAGDDPKLVTYELVGDLTLHGVKRPLSFPAKGETSDGMTQLRGSFDLLQSEYGIKPYKAALGAVGVKDSLRIYGDLWIHP